MTVYAGDDAIYTPRRGKPVRARVMGHTAKRVCIAYYITVEALGGRAFASTLVSRYVKPERLERFGGGLLDGNS